MVGSRVYVGGLPFGVRDRDLEKFFKGFGRIRDILIKNGYGFVEFEDYRDADDAVYELNGKDLLGERVTVERARGMPRGSDRWRSRDQPPPRRPPPPRPGREARDQSVLHARKNQDDNYRYGPPTRTEYRLVVENLSSRISWQDLKDYMRQAGEVTYADAHKQHRNEGVVEFATHSDMRAAIEKLDNTELNGRRIRLVEDRRSSRRRTRSSSSRSRSRSRARRSRSRSRAGRSRSRSKSKGKSKSPAAKSRSRSRSKDRSRSKSRSGSPRRADRRSGSRGSERKSEDRNGHRSKSRSPAKSKERSRSRSKEAGSPKREEREERRVSKSRSRSRSRSRSASRGRSRSRDRSASRSRSRSRSPRQNGDAPDDRSPRSGD
ncbi:serine-arginine protein 55 isoform X2 [Leguminivora glycinivorella]|uniref:serine-arginine protein 55 isoform X2 n=1 Tax=Leguminivora glycinivorella TaxID=1035111 RepID=UPI00200E4327|nr:serine-arginine protein 55 isoform X2 [Leguminivora glycinivorella]